MENDLIILFEIIATLATILTIVYLANQIRLSNKLALSSIEHQLFREYMTAVPLRLETMISVNFYHVIGPTKT